MKLNLQIEDENESYRWQLSCSIVFVCFNYVAVVRVDISRAALKACYTGLVIQLTEKAYEEILSISCMKLFVHTTSKYTTKQQPVLFITESKKSVLSIMLCFKFLSSRISQRSQQKYIIGCFCNFH